MEVWKDIFVVRDKRIGRAERRVHKSKKKKEKKKVG